MLKNFINKTKAFLKEEKGDISVKGIAITVAVIVVIGAVVAFITGGFSDTAVTSVWDMLIGFIEDTLM